MGISIVLPAIMHAVHVVLWWQLLGWLLGGFDVIIVGLLVAGHVGFVIARCDSSEVWGPGGQGPAR